MTYCNRGLRWKWISASNSTKAAGMMNAGRYERVEHDQRQEKESGNSLPELLKPGLTVDLISKYGMKRGHVARFKTELQLLGEILFQKPIISKTNTAYDVSLEQSMADLKIKDGHVFKAIVASMPDEPGACGCVQATPVIESVAPCSSIKNTSVQKLMPDYKIGMEHLVKTKTLPMGLSQSSDVINQQ
ncbi:hypothetical protein HAX54_014840 [Datura stramonium]|uniref:Uncharacterized protein n=1 Tax=Datura stramonium TaxID=4076 RepID=A0ABS8TRK0_DATST|nr:hypothetical protein [Datura stramonium]